MSSLLTLTTLPTILLGVWSFEFYNPSACLSTRRQLKDTDEGGRGDGQDGPDGDRLLGVTQVTGPVRTGHDP